MESGSGTGTTEFHATGKPTLALVACPYPGFLHELSIDPHLVTLAGTAGQVQQTTRLTPAQRDILAQLAVEPPPPLTSLTPAA